MTSPNRPENRSMCVTPGKVSFVNCGKSSMVISPYFAFICSVVQPPLDGDRCATGARATGRCGRAPPGAVPAGAAAVPPPPPPRPPPGRLLKIERIGHVHDAMRSRRSLSVRNCASARSAGFSRTVAAVNPAPAARKKSRRSMPSLSMSVVLFIACFLTGMDACLRPRCGSYCGPGPERGLTPGGQSGV